MHVTIINLAWEKQWKVKSLCFWNIAAKLLSLRIRWQDDTFQKIKKIGQEKEAIIIKASHSKNNKLKHSQLKPPPNRPPCIPLHRPELTPVDKIVFLASRLEIVLSPVVDSPLEATDDKVLDVDIIGHETTDFEHVVGRSDQEGWVGDHIEYSVFYVINTDEDVFRAGGWVVRDGGKGKRRVYEGFGGDNQAGDDIRAANSRLVHRAPLNLALNPLSQQHSSSHCAIRTLNPLITHYSTIIDYFHVIQKVPAFKQADDPSCFVKEGKTVLSLWSEQVWLSHFEDYLLLVC